MQGGGCTGILMFESTLDVTSEEVVLSGERAVTSSIIDDATICPSAFCGEEFVCRLNML
jgi:hypothetical protein